MPNASHSSQPHWNKVYDTVYDTRAVPKQSIYMHDITTYLFEFSLSCESINTMLGPSSPSDTVVGIEVNARSSLVLVDQLQSIVVDEHVGRATLKFVCRNCLFDRSYRGHNDGVQPFLVDRTLDRDMWKSSILETRRAVRRKEFGVLGHLANRPNALCETADNDLSKKLNTGEWIVLVRWARKLLRE